MKRTLSPILVKYSSRTDSRKLNLISVTYQRAGQWYYGPSMGGPNMEDPMLMSSLEIHGVGSPASDYWLPLHLFALEKTLLSESPFGNP